MAKLFLLLHLLLFVTTISSSLADANYKYLGCSQSKYDENSPYKSNVDNLLSAISNAASTSLYAKFTSASASSSTPVYGLFQCRGDLDTSSCQPCVRSALSQLPPLCPAATAASIQLDGCVVRYSNDSFIGKEETNLLYKNCGPLPSNGYDPSLVAMRDDALGTIESSGGTGGTYRVGAAGYIQAGAQCVGDLSANDCADCITSAVGQLKSLCGGAVSGEVYLGKCFAKYYSGGAYVSTPSSSSSSSGSDS